MGEFPATVEQILVGYVRTDCTKNGWCEASGSVTLICAGSRKILVDCGNPWNGSELLQALETRGLHPQNVTDLVITHGHSDHCGNLAVFSSANIYMDRDVGTCCARYSSIFASCDEHLITDEVTICQTPGHTDNDLSVVVRGTSKGTVVIAGDIFEDGQNDQWEANSRYPDQQRLSREKILGIADWIIPGHGSIFKNCMKN